MHNQLCLLIETSSSKGSLALVSLASKEDKLINIKQWEGSHSSFITSAFDFSIYKKLSYLVLGVGPGRFTGVRVGVSFAKTLSYILGIPIYPLSSLKILAESQIKQSKAILVLVNAFQNSLYMALYQKKGSTLKELISPQVILPKDLEKKLEDLEKKIKTEYVCVGDGYKAYENFWSDDFKKKLKVQEIIFPSVKYMASLLKREFNSSHLIEWENLNPVYLSSPVRVIKQHEG